MKRKEKNIEKNSAKNNVPENPHFLEIFQILTDDFLSSQNKKKEMKKKLNAIVR